MTANKEWIIGVGCSTFKYVERSSQLLDSSDKEVHLSKLGKQLLLFLMRNPGMVISIDELMDNVWPGKFVESGTVNKLVRQVRKALGDTDGKSSICTIRAEGYRFDGQIIQNPEVVVELTVANNGLKVLHQVVSFWPFRSSFDSESKVAKLFCDVSFKDGRFSASDRKDKVGFRLTLSQAELHIRSDSAEVLQIVPGSLREHRSSLNSEIVVHRLDATPSTTVFGFEGAVQGGNLKGAVWEDGLNSHLLKVRDLRQDTKGESAEIEVQVRCHREDMIVSDIYYAEEANMELWENASLEKRLMVKQYLREELIQRGLVAGDLDDPFSVFILASAVTREEHV